MFQQLSNGDVQITVAPADWLAILLVIIESTDRWLEVDPSRAFATYDMLDRVNEGNPLQCYLDPPGPSLRVVPPSHS